MIGMCLGEKSTIIIPPEYGYGANGAGKDIPGGATLRFTVDIVGLNNELLNFDPIPNVFEQMDGDRDMMITEEEMAHWFLTQHPDKLESIPPQLFQREDKNGVSESWSYFLLHLSDKSNISLDIVKITIVDHFDWSSILFAISHSPPPFTIITHFCTTTQ